MESPAALASTMAPHAINTYVGPSGPMFSMARWQCRNTTPGMPSVQPAGRLLACAGRKQAGDVHGIESPVAIAELAADLHVAALTKQ